MRDYYGILRHHYVINAQIQTDGGDGVPGGEQIDKEIRCEEYSSRMIRSEIWDAFSESGKACTVDRAILEKEFSDSNCEW